MPIQPALDPRFEALLEYLKRTRGFDFSGYKRASLVRRVQRRMSMVGMDTFNEYMDFLEVHPQEFIGLFNTILINVTAFFRYKEAWEFLADRIIPELIIGTDEIRVWSAGCASGQEPYSIAMLLCEALGEQQYLERVKIYATDVDEEALAQARQASYVADALEPLDQALVEKYFVHNNGTLSFRPNLRRKVIFGRHDLVQDAPIPKLDLLICRNTLMYLNAETQSRILARFHFALKPAGTLFLGRAEMLLSHSDIFQPRQLQHRIFSKVLSVDAKNPLSMSRANEGVSQLYLSDQAKLGALSFDQVGIATFVIDSNSQLVLANKQACALFKIPPSDLGKPFSNFDFSYRPIELSSLIEQVLVEKGPMRLSKVVYSSPNGESRHFEVQVMPVGLDNRIAAVAVTFDDASKFYRLYDELRSTHEEMETTNEELESTNEELESTNEELQSMNEELETTNEELQSANEELETTNAEMQATNDELETTNTDLRTLTAEVERPNAFLQIVLRSLNQGVIVIDQNQKIRVWNEKSEDLWGWRLDEVLGKNLFDLDVGLPLDELKSKIADMPEESSALQVELAAVNRRGRHFVCSVRLSPLGGRREGGMVLLAKEIAASQS